MIASLGEANVRKWNAKPYGAARAALDTSERRAPVAAP
jgi:hypothetical protein